MRRRKVARLADRTRMCRRCATSLPETGFPGDGWICPECARLQVAAAMPILERNGWQRYDTARVFSGYRVRKVRQGDGPEYETEVASDAGEFYAYGEAMLAIYAKNERWVNILLGAFPGTRCVVRGDDGRGVVAIPVALWPEVAKRCRARRRRQPSPENLAQLAAARGRIGAPKEIPHAPDPEPFGGLFGGH
jgi:hypothetical protein